MLAIGFSFLVMRVMSQLTFMLKLVKHLFVEKWCEYFGNQGD